MLQDIIQYTDSIIMWGISSLKCQMYDFEKELKVKSCPRPPRGSSQHCSQFKGVTGLHDLLWTGNGKKINIYVFARSNDHCPKINTLSTASRASPLYQSPLQSKIPFHLKKKHSFHCWTMETEFRWARRKFWDQRFAQLKTLINTMINLTEPEKGQTLLMLTRTGES